MKVMVTDPVADLLTRIRNAEMARHSECIIPYSKMKESIVSILESHGYINGFEVKGEIIEKVIIAKLVLERSYKVSYKRVSKPGQRIYKKYTEIKPIQNGLGIAIYSTSRGVVDDITAKKNKIGGEVLCEVW